MRNDINPLVHAPKAHIALFTYLACGEECKKHIARISVYRKSPQGIYIVVGLCPTHKRELIFAVISRILSCRPLVVLPSSSSMRLIP